MYIWHISPTTGQLYNRREVIQPHQSSFTSTAGIYAMYTYVTENEKRALLSQKLKIELLVSLESPSSYLHPGGFDFAIAHSVEYLHALKV